MQARAQTPPTDNPITTFYGANYFPWTDDLAWANVYNILDYGGVADGVTDNGAAFKAARDAAAAQGGGVVYFPTGTYAFADTIALANGVVLRGDDPGVPAVGDDFFPPSQLVFPQYVPTLSGDGTDDNTAFKQIQTASPTTDSRIGIVNLDVNHAGINFTESDNLKFSPSFDPLRYTAKQIVVFGLRNNNAAYPWGAVGVPESVPASFQNRWQRYPFPFACNVQVIAAADVIVANNRLNDLSYIGQDDSFDQPGYLFQNPANQVVAAEPGQAVFDYGNIYCVSVNGAYLISRGGEAGWYATDDPNDMQHPYRPELFRPGIVIQDNWMYHDEGQTVVASGSGLILNRNIMLDRPNKMLWISNRGQKAPSGSAFTTRACLLGGRNIDTEDNFVLSYPWTVNGGPYHTNDGENLLWDNTSTLVNGWRCVNNTLNGLLSNYFCQNINDVLISGNTWVTPTGNADGAAIWETADVVRNPNFRVNNVRIANNTNLPGDIMLIGSAGGSGNTIIGNRTDGRMRFISYSTKAQIDIRDNIGFELRPR